MSLGINISDLLAESLSNKAFFNKNSVIGDTVTGTILDSEVRQSRDFDDNKLEFWDDNSPRLQMVINLQTALSDDEDDDGIRSVYVKWWGPQRKALLTAAKDAAVSDLAPGDTFTASYIGDGEQTDRKKSAPKIYAYGLTPGGPIAKAAAKGKAA